MSLHFKKSKKIGGIRVTMSKSGLGVSAGSKHLRAGIGADGKSYVSGGTNGIRYREQLGTENNTSVISEESQLENPDYQENTPPSLEDYKNWRGIGICQIIIAIPICFIPYIGIFAGIILALLGITLFRKGVKGIKECQKTDTSTDSEE